jgi:glutamate-1-semialdehyde 2,1-aminomutase
VSGLNRPAPTAPKLRVPGRLVRQADLFERARAVLPGGVNSPVRAMGQIGRDPIFIERGAGAEVTDREGRTYIDWVGSWGPLILGHADPGVVEAVTAAARLGTTFGAATEAEVELAESVAGRMPSVEMIRMTSSGTEAAMSAVRLARAVTGREVVVKFAGGYHGHADGLLAEAGSGVATLGVPSGPGITPAQSGDTVVVDWNDREGVGAALEGHEVAALVAEPVAANMGVVPPAPGFLEYLREATRASGTMLVFDEVITGFRVARGGAQELYGIDPDLTVMGKVLGGGLPAAAFGGPATHMERIAPAGDVYQAGTLSGNPLAVAAGLATLSRLDPAAYARLGELTARLRDGLAKLADDLPLQVSSAPGLVTLFFNREPVSDFRDAAASDLEAHARFCRLMLDRGIYLPPAQFEAWFVSLAHDEESIDRTLRAAGESLEQVY